MKRFIIFLLAACALCFTFENAIARGRGGGHSRPSAHRPGPSHRPRPAPHIPPPRHHHHRYSSTSIGLSFGFPVWPYPAYSSYYPSPYEPYYPYPSSQTVVIQSAPAQTQYIEKDDTNADDNTSKTEEQYWYYCKNPQGYYPYVEKCNTQWQKVIPFPQDAH